MSRNLFTSFSRLVLVCGVMKVALNVIECTVVECKIVGIRERHRWPVVTVFCIYRLFELLCVKGVLSGRYRALPGKNERALEHARIILVADLI